MTALKQLIICTVFFFLGGCNSGPLSVVKSEHEIPDWHPHKVAAESEKVADVQKTLVKSLEKVPPRKIEVEPIIPSYDPLEDHIVSFSAVDEDFQLVLYSLAQTVGLNLIIDPDLGKNERLVTLSFEQVSAATVFREVLRSFDLYYEIIQNIIRIKAFEERLFTLNFLDTDVDMAFDMGGDVLGVGESEASGGLAGNFKLSGRGSKWGNVYDLVDQMVKRVISKEGKYSLNRLSGSLYIKDTPSGIKAVSRLINHLKEMMSRQILIEARIIEVTLSDKYAYGIDWSILRGQSNQTTRLNEASWSLGKGLVMSGVHSSFSVDVTVDALKTFGDTNIVSNPSVRSKHGKPALLSVGTSFTYQKSITTTETSTTSQTEDTTEVEVSTVFDGLILGIVPFIEEGGRISLLINPIKSDVDRDSLEPVAVGGASSNSISLPQVSIKEISSTISLNDGDVIFLGGLIDKYSQTEEQGVPILSSIPLLGYLFKDESVIEEARELVIVLSVTVL